MSDRKGRQVQIHILPKTKDRWVYIDGKRHPANRDEFRLPSASYMRILRVVRAMARRGKGQLVKCGSGFSFQEEEG